MGCTGLISADSHIDPEYLPRDIFTARVSSRWRERVPRVVDTADGPFWTVDGDRLMPWGPIPIRQQLGRTLRGKTMVAAGFDPEQLRPSNPTLRIEDQERDGVDLEVIYGPLRRWKYLVDMDPKVATTIVRAYNDYIADFCMSCPGRFYALGGVPPTNLEAIVGEIQHIAELGLVGAEVPFEDPERPLFDPYWEPLRAAAAEYDVPVHVHLEAPPKKRWNPQLSLASRAIYLCTAPMQLDETLAAVIFSGCLERHPNLRVITAETGIGWIPYLLDRMDWEWDNYQNDWQALTRTRPSDLYRRQMYATFQGNSIGPLLAHLYPENFMWGSDYPHSDGIWPDSQEKILKIMGHIDLALRQNIVKHNAARLYQIR